MHVFCKIFTRVFFYWLGLGLCVAPLAADPFVAVGYGESKFDANLEDQTLYVGAGLNLRQDLIFELGYADYGSVRLPEQGLSGGGALNIRLIAELMLGSDADLKFALEGGLDDLADFFYSAGVVLHVAPKIKAYFSFGRHNLNSSTDIDLLMLRVRFY